MAHKGKQPRMLQGQTAETEETFNHHPNIRTHTPSPNPMPAQVNSVYRRTLGSVWPETRVFEKDNAPTAGGGRTAADFSAPARSKD
jgi:hypothetical protein